MRPIFDVIVVSIEFIHTCKRSSGGVCTFVKNKSDRDETSIIFFIIS